MNLLARTAEFERLCFILTKRAQNPNWRIDETGKMVNKIPPASLSGPTPRFAVPPVKEPNMSSDPGFTANPRVTKDPRMNNSVAKPAPLQPGAHPGAPAHSESTPVKTPAKTPSVPAKPTKTPAPWLEKYKTKMDAEAPAPWLEKYKAKMDEDEEVESDPMDRALERANKPSAFNADEAAADQVSRAKNPYGQR